MPAVNRERDEALKTHFEKARQVSYTQQAQFFHGLITRAWAQGFSFAGYADLHGQPILVARADVTGELWGWRDDTRTAGLLCVRARAGDSWQTVHDPLPLAPLFSFRGDRAALLRQATSAASVSSSAPAVSLYLPPLFAGSP